VTRAAFRVLVIEDDPAVRRVLRALLKGEGYTLNEAATAARAVIEARSYRPDLLLVDLGLPDADGIAVIRRVRSWSTVPILALSAKDGEEEKIAALDAGADDYIAKPFSGAELLARVRAGLRRRSQGSQRPPVLKLGRLRIDLGRRHVRGPKGEVHLTPLEYRVLDAGRSSHRGRKYRNRRSTTRSSSVSESLVRMRATSEVMPSRQLPAVSDRTLCQASTSAARPRCIAPARGKLPRPGGKGAARVGRA
jgi:two-component system KDP operon response regulator KdpE